MSGKEKTAAGEAAVLFSENLPVLLCNPSQTKEAKPIFIMPPEYG
jgi:hypothetical protein